MNLETSAQRMEDVQGEMNPKSDLDPTVQHNIHRANCGQVCRGNLHLVVGQSGL